MKSDKIITEIQELIKKANKINDIENLISINMKLAGYYFYLIEDENNSHRLYLDCYNTRKEFEASHVVTGEGSVSKLQNESVVLSKEMRRNEVDSEIMWNRIKGIRLAVNQFIDVNTQKIAHLRKENEQVKKN